MATDKREIVTDLLARNKMGPATKAAADDLDKVGRAADKAGDQAEDFSKSSVLAGEGAERMGKESATAARHVDKLQDEIKQTERELVKLAAAFAATGDASERLDISKSVRKTQNELRRLTSNKKILEDAFPDSPGKLKNFTNAVSGAFSKITATAAEVGPQVGRALGAALAPSLVGALNSAIVGAVGIAGIGAGVALAVSGDQKLQEAGTIAGKRFLTGMQKGAAAGLSGPIMRSIDLLSSAGDRITTKWTKTFHVLGDSVVPLTKDIITGVERISDALANVASKSGPAIAAIGDSFILLADGAADFLEALTGSKSANDSLVTIAGTLGTILTVTGWVIKKIDEFLEAGGKWMPLTLPATLLGKLFKKMADDAGDATDAVQEHTQALSNNELAARGNADALGQVNNELKKQADPVFALRDAQMKLAEAHDKSTEAVKKHGASSKEAKEATRNLAKAALELQGSVGALGKDFDGKLSPAMRSSLAAAGLTKREINDVESEFRAARKAGDSYAKTYAATTKVYGADTARKSLFSVKEVADDIPRAVSIGIRITGVGNVSAAAAAIRKQYARARGGPVQAGQPYWVGEEGPELVFPSGNGTVINASASRRMAAGLPTGYAAGGSPASSSPAGGTRVVFDITGAETKFKAWMREWIRTEGVLT